AAKSTVKRIFSPFFLADMKNYSKSPSSRVGPVILLPGGDTSRRLRYPEYDMSSLVLDRARRPAPESPRAANELIDVRAIAADLEVLAKDTSGDRELRSALAQRLKAALVEGRAKAEQLLLKDRHGRRCAQRLCRMEDEVIRLAFDFARKHLYPSENPSEA